MKNRLTDLNDHLFCEIERLGDEGLQGEELHMEVTRANAMCTVATQIINNARLIYDAARMADELPGVSNVALLGVK